MDMIFIDENELSETAAKLLRTVMKHTPESISKQQLDLYRKQLFPILIDFLRRDVPCGVKASSILFEELFEQSDLARTKFYDQNDLDSLALKIAPQLHFDRYNTSKPPMSANISEIRIELQSSFNAALKKTAYNPKKLCDGVLSVEADSHNSAIFRQQFNNFCRADKLYESIDNTIEQIQQIIEQTLELQLMLAPNSNFGANIQIRRKKKAPEDQGGFPGASF